MASDAYMELETRDLIGESSDERFGMDSKGRQEGAFEISSFSFKAAAQGGDKDDGSKSTTQGRGANQSLNRRTSSVGGSSKQREITIDNFTIKKEIDSASPVLFRLCCKQTVIDWAIISLCEAGEIVNPDISTKRKPWLVLEFQQLTVEEFNWDLNPAASGDEVKEQETITFKFAKIRFKYFGQGKTGQHDVPMKTIAWNQQDKDNRDDVPDLGSENW